ncbi:hypothetical protein RUND412_003355 [Rhizina undulata]
MKNIDINEDSVMQLQAMGVEREDAIACLKACDNDLNRAAEYYFDGDLAKRRLQAVNDVKWNESVWDAPREGLDTSAQSGHNFHNNYQSQSRTDTARRNYQVQGPDVLTPSFEGMKSRPPSRTSNRIDLTGPEDNDADLAKALAASMEYVSGVNTAGYYTQQETGITGTHTSPTNPYFGPAPPDREYDPGQWALTTTQTHEIYLDPAPVDRRRLPGEPAFLKPAAPGQNLHAAITILHSIPLAREKLLMRDRILPDYGQDGQWWNGRKIQASRIINLADDEMPAWSDVPDEIAEVQRIMAFLDQTKRAYGSVESLANISSIKDTSSGPVSSFLLAWGEDKYVEPFFSVATQQPLVDIETPSSTNAEESLSTERFYVLDLQIPAEPESTIYDAFDRVIWPGDGQGEVYVKFADVLCLQFKTNWDPRKGSGVNIPTELYPDRYTRTYADIAREVQQKIQKKLAEIDDLEQKEERLLKFRPRGYGRGTETYDPKALMEISFKHFETGSQFNAVDSGSANMSISSDSGVLDVNLALKQLWAKIEKKLSNLSSLKQEAHVALKKLRASFTSPEDKPENFPPLTKYSLRGFCPDSKTTYLLRNSADGSGEQWWSISWGTQNQAATASYETTATASYELRMISVEDVLEATKNNGDGDLLLIYANENALNPKDGVDMSLPEPLQMFIDRDNAAFQTELQPTSPGKKRRLNKYANENEESEHSGSPKRISSTRSSATLGMATPEHSRRNSLSGNEVEMAESGNGGGIVSGLMARGDLADLNVSRITGGANIIRQMVELPPREEMMERGHISPVAKAFHLDRKGKGRKPVEDEEMVDAEHVEFAGSERKGG